MIGVGPQNCVTSYAGGSLPICTPFGLLGLELANAASRLGKMRFS